MKKHTHDPVLALDDDHSRDSPALKPLLLANVGPWGGSALVHGLFLLTLLLWTIPIIQQGTLQLTAFTGLGEDENELENMSFSLTPNERLEVDQSEASPLDAADSNMLHPDEVQLELLHPELSLSEVSLLQVPHHSVSSQLASTYDGDALGEANSVEAAIDRITGSIQGRLESGDLLVVWLLDSSLSLEKDRQRIAKRLESFLATDNSNHRLLNAVAVFGRSIKETVAPTDSSRAVLRAIQNAPVDKSGRENIFAAVEKSLAKYRKRWKAQMMFVIWTDESGDDVDRLDKTIARARKANVAVSVVGKSAVLGSATAFQDWTNPKTGRQVMLPVQNGPDSAMPERLRLGYWFRGPPPMDVRQSGRRFPKWYGDDDLVGMSSTYGPWALTRLAAQTGGTFTRFDRQEDRPPYDAERMALYRPEYESLVEYRRGLSNHPLRQAVHRAVRVTYSQEIEIPDLMFFGLKSPKPPHAIQPLYFKPAAFRAKLLSSRGHIARQIQHASYAIEQALAHVSSADDLELGMEDLYLSETSPRWKAWYDLTRGRLLAISVRLEEYRLTMEAIVRGDGLQKTTNGIVLGPTSTLRSGQEHQRRAAEARRLLTRCLEDHADTPWAYLAERELSKGLGIAVRQMSYTPSGTVSKQSGAKTPRL